MATNKNSIAISINSAWNFVNFRLGLIRRLQIEGWDVIAIAPQDEHFEVLRNAGIRCIDIAIDNGKTNPINDLILLNQYFRILRAIQPAVFLAFTAKPNIYGTIAANALGIPVINNVAGQGSVFIHGGPLATLVRGMYRFALKRSNWVFFQNKDDLAEFTARNLVNGETASLVPGSGVNISRFQFSVRQKDHTQPFVFLFMARLLWDKGIGELIDATRRLRQEFGNHLKLQILGFCDVKNPRAVSKEQLLNWVDEGVCEYLGETSNVLPFIEASDCVVLPSYREGTPRALLEAASVGRPIVTTDVPGCREVVEDGINGFLCRERDSGDLFLKMLAMLELPPDARLSMSRASRKIVETKFDEEIVCDIYSRKVRELFQSET